LGKRQTVQYFHDYILSTKALLSRGYIQKAMRPIIVLSTTLEKKEDGERLARLLLESKLIACAQMSGPITSYYRWQGVVTSATEFTLSLKTTPQCTDKVKELLSQEHPYDLPEIIVQKIDNSSDEYSNWVYEEVEQ
jgi:periplasmic divalent cation tolerance protein